MDIKDSNHAKNVIQIAFYARGIDFLRQVRCQRRKTKQQLNRSCLKNTLWIIIILGEKILVGDYD